MTGKGSEQLIPLSMLNAGEYGTVSRIEGGVGVRKKLADLGIIRGKTIGIAHGKGGGPRVVVVENTRVMLGRGLLHKIIIEQRPGSEQKRM
jgi:ferrous iron transport protein A